MIRSTTASSQDGQGYEVIAGGAGQLKEGQLFLEYCSFLQPSSRYEVFMR